MSSESGRDSRVVKVSDRGVPCHDFEPSKNKKTRCVGQRCTLNLWRAEKRLPAGIFDAKYAPRTHRPIVKNVDKITEIIEPDRHVSSRSIAQELKINHKTVLNYLRRVGFKKKPDVWSPHQLIPKNMMDRISICEALALRNEISQFLKWIVTWDKKWVTYDNIVRKRSWSKRVEAAQLMARPGLTARKVLLCIWWDWKGIIYFELLPYGQTLKSDMYC
ncbi:histone-lysine N-methyltransferase SETMAR [Trichonephila clavipes]|nr:histone-lysine N-methyltransferase SETMAR [Trichonephila clavipes]